MLSRLIDVTLLSFLFAYLKYVVIIYKHSRRLLSPTTPVFLDEMNDFHNMICRALDSLLLEWVVFFDEAHYRKRVLFI